MDMKAEVLIGAELWDMIGGSGTFEELLAVINEVRNEVPLL
jgi:predicted Rossmann-fold nucleotide-binding protein